MINCDHQFERKVRNFMRSVYREYLDDCGEGVDITAIAEAAQRKFGIDPDVDTAADEFTYEAAFETSLWVEENWDSLGLP